MDYKQKAVEYKQEGHTFKQLCEAFGIPLKHSMTGKQGLPAGILIAKSNVNANGK